MIARLAKLVFMKAKDKRRNADNRTKISLIAKVELVTLSKTKWATSVGRNWLGKAEAFFSLKLIF